MTAIPGRRSGHVGLVVAYLVGGGLVAYGLWALFTTRMFADLLPVLVWFVGVLVAHDGVTVPLTLAAGVVVLWVVPARLRAPVQAGLFVTAAATLAAIPFVLGFGRKPDNPSLLPLPYGRNLLVLVAVVWIVVAVVCLATVAPRRSRRRRPGR